MNPNDYYRMKSAEVRAVAVAIWEVEMKGVDYENKDTEIHC